MKNILENIIADKRTEVNERQTLYPVCLLERSLYFSEQPVSLRHYLARPGSSGIIAEFKRRSPSKGGINPYADPEKTTLAYMQAGAAALSVLTDEKYFGGCSEDLESARRVNYCPILRKDFIIDEYQVIESRAIGADAILLIAAVLSAGEIKKLSGLAASIGLEVLLELHDESELDRIVPGISLVGINNRALSDFSVDTKRSYRMASLIGNEFTLVSESGISDPAEIENLREAGFSGFLIGESFMKNADPGKACAQFISSVRTREKKSQPC